MTQRAADIPAGRIEILTSSQDVAFPGEWYELSDPSHFWFEWRFIAALRLMKDLRVPLASPLRMLDVGAGSGALRDQLEAATGWIIDIADLSAAVLARAGRGRGRTLCYDVCTRNEALVGTYDGVVLFDVLEHVRETEPFVRALVDHVKPGGHLLVNVPASQALYGAYDRAVGHERRYSPETLRAELERAGIEVEAVRYWGFLVVPLLLARRWVVRGRCSGAESVRRGFAPPGAVAHSLLRLLMRLETAVLHRPPFGTSLLLYGRRGAR